MSHVQSQMIVRSVEMTFHIQSSLCVFFVGVALLVMIESNQISQYAAIVIITAKALVRKAAAAEAATAATSQDN